MNLHPNGLLTLHSEEGKASKAMSSIAGRDPFHSQFRGFRFAAKVKDDSKKL